MFLDYPALDATSTLVALEDAVLARREAELADLELCLHWADLHARDPRDDVELFGPVPPGGERLVGLGGPGTPDVRELAVCELGIARGVHTNAARKVLGDVLDLRHRLPLTFDVLRSLEAEAWVARRVAVMSRHLALDVMGVVDAAVADAIGGQSPGRVLELAAAKIIEADQVAHERRVAAEKVRRFVGLTRADGSGSRTVIARVSSSDALAVEATVVRVAQILATDPACAGLSADGLRAVAFGWLARPVELLVLLTRLAAEQATGPAPADPTEQGSANADTVPEDTAPEHAVPEDVGQDDPAPEEPAQDAPLPHDLAWVRAQRVAAERAAAERAAWQEQVAELLRVAAGLDLSVLRPRAVLYVHLHEGVLAGAVPGVARVEGLGPVTLGELQKLLAGCEVVVKPVIDVGDLVSTAAYEHPEAMKERIHLLRPGDQFPHATTRSRNVRRVDVDHPVPWDPEGPPDQTNSHAGQPLGRTVHRAKTHLGYTCLPTQTGEMVWRTPHGLHRVVDGSGTHHLDALDALDWTSDDPLDQALTRILHRLRTGQL